MYVFFIKIIVRRITILSSIVESLEQVTTFPTRKAFQPMKPLKSVVLSDS